MILYSYNVSPYAAKVRAILRYKGLAFEERVVHPLHRKELKEVAPQGMVPTLVDGDRVVVDSTHIARFLDEKYPAKSILPADPALRARALLLEEWADEGLPRVVQPVRWLIPENFDKSIRLFRSAYPSTATENAVWLAFPRLFRLDLVRRFGDRFGAPPARTILNRLAAAMDVLDAALAETGWLAGPSPSVADFAAWGLLHFLEGLDGWETVKARKRVLKLIRSLSDQPPVQPESYDADDQAVLDASHHRRTEGGGKKNLPLV